MLLTFQALPFNNFLDLLNVYIQKDNLTPAKIIDKVFETVDQ